MQSELNNCMEFTRNIGKQFVWIDLKASKQCQNKHRNVIATNKYPRILCFIRSDSNHSSQFYSMEYKSRTWCVGCLVLIWYESASDLNSLQWIRFNAKKYCIEIYEQMLNKKKTIANMCKTFLHAVCLVFGCRSCYCRCCCYHYRFIRYPLDFYVSLCHHSFSRHCIC